MSNNQKMPYIISDSKKIERIKVGDSGDLIDYGTCGDCGAKEGELHLENCDLERCPVCHRQLLSCDCWTHYASEDYVEDICEFDGKYAFLSNFYESPIEIEGISYPTVEHAFQAMKTLDNKERLAISKLDTPGKAKRAGRKVALREDWEEIKNKVMYDCVYTKFSDPQLKQMLLDTAPAHLEEGNTWHDNCWGNCHCEKCKNIPGENRLGNTLTKVREELKQK
jgi:ribA/ribD-fused uncharacterized protein